jgi:hypothetical protein
MFNSDPMHIARLAQLEGALCALLREAASDHEPNEVPDSISATLTNDGLDIEYRRGVVPVGGEGV